MPSFGKKSKETLATAHKDLQKVANKVIKYFDCSVISGHRTPEGQFELFKKGRSLNIDGNWIITDKGKVVTYKDGFIKLSKHNHYLSRAIDIIPYPIEWKNTNRMKYFAGMFMGIARLMYDRGEISNEIVWGGDWDADTDLDDQTFKDIPHFQIS